MDTTWVKKKIEWETKMVATEKKKEVKLLHPHVNNKVNRAKKG